MYPLPVLRTQRRVLLLLQPNDSVKPPIKAFQSKQGNSMAEFSLHHVHHESADVDATVAFYVEHFQGEVTERTVRDGVQWARVKIGDFMLNVTDRGESDIHLGRYNGLDHIGIHTTDFDATVEALKGAGVGFFIEPVSPAPGIRIAFVAGPDNTKIELIQVASA